MKRNEALLLAKKVCAAFQAGNVLFVPLAEAGTVTAVSSYSEWWREVS